MPLSVASEKHFGDLSRQMGRIFEQMKGYSNFAPGEVWSPSVNLYETDQMYLVCVDLAGVDKDRIDISVEGNLLRIHGRREIPPPGEPARSRVKMHLMEIDHGAFSRDVELPVDVKQDNISARHTNGLLWIELPKG